MKHKWDTIIHVGFDDTDSLQGSCTTHLALKIVEKIHNKVVFLDYPRLIRNNPNIPWKTRGNGAIALTFGITEEDFETIKDIILKNIENYHEEDENTNPGLAIIKGEIPPEISNFAKETLVKVIEIEKAKNLAKKHCIFYHTIGNGRGLIGGLAAIGNQLYPNEEDYTFEILTYRKPDFIGTKRAVKTESIYNMDAELSPLVFNNIDDESNKILICPAGPDPVLYGIRGEEAEVVLKAYSIVKVIEPIEGYCIFRTNQGTDQHFKYANSKIVNNGVFVGKIKVLEKPTTQRGGHIIFKGNLVEEGITLNIAAFEPSKGFRRTIEQLYPDDEIIAYGGVKYKPKFNTFTVHLEKCEITHVSDQFKKEAPFCPECQKRMTSDGYKKGYKCRNCGYKDKKLTKISVMVERTLKKKLIIPPAQAQRHLVKPHRRYDVPKKQKLILIDQWWKWYSEE